MKSVRSNKGTLLAELPLAMWIMFVVITIPMIDLATITLRTTFLVTAAHHAASAAARSTYFQTNNGSSLSAKQAAQTQATYDLQRFGMSLTTPVTTNIVTTTVGTNQTTRTSAPLITPPDSTNNTYSIEVIVTSQVNPLIPFNLRYFGTVPGLTAPMTITCAAQEFSENPQGLTK